MYQKNMMIRKKKSKITITNMFNINRKTLYPFYQHNKITKKMGPIESSQYNGHWWQHACNNRIKFFHFHFYLPKNVDNNWKHKVNPIQDGGGGGGGGEQKDPPTSFSLVTSTNVGISPKTFMTFSFNTFTTLV